MILKIKNSMVARSRMSGGLYEHLYFRAKHKGVSLSEYIAHGMAAYSGFKQPVMANEGIKEEK